MSKKVLIVDDSETERKIIANSISKLGLDIVEATDGDEGIQMAKLHKPDLIIMDVVMPKMNGFNALRAISRDVETSGIPVIICSSKDQPTDIAWGKIQGAKEYITKPINGKEMAVKVKSLLGL